MLPYLFRMVPSEAALPLAIQAVIEEYGWMRVALLTQDVSVFATVSWYILTIPFCKAGMPDIHNNMEIKNGILIKEVADDMCNS